MPRPASSSSGLIGPNAVLQTIPVLDGLLGRERRDDVLSRVELSAVPDGTQMIPETLAAGLHRHIRLIAPAQAARVSTLAGTATANYILAYRIPKPAQILLRCLPATLSAKCLSHAITRHAWTFVGSGQFAALDPWTFDIHNNPLIRAETSSACLCHWHAAVFARLYQALVSTECSCREIMCGAQPPGGVCRFEIRVAGSAG
ncbi:bacteriochlorophyll synthase 23 kDa chain [Roseobacter cerasinus]|uniref:Bacteriochlorophyll synthase 23 kDa chain n=1 Tax=Roseobacter cerasinus TaxID=2602289 RepID=A0A640VNH0_9RHOB|nr:bacteriochlorophyll 4-vinyl reductase [Roseobacter cerasinus]GFE48405.1 bacteriochlorophyll synthase 23 kDa chain [Roseobacter cerasinus]